jgi:DNA excision repair protein ERCC-2
MLFDLDQRSAALNVGELADFALGPRDGGGGAGGLWRAQLGTYWHQQLRAQATSEHPAAQFEVTIEGRVAHRGWTISLTGRIDQWLELGGVTVLREIKTVMRPLPINERELRAEYASYFAQLATYVALRRIATAGAPASPLRAELVFVEAGSGLAQTVALTPADDAIFRVQLERVTEFLDLRHRARERLRRLRFQPAFAQLRPGQETTRTELEAALQGQHGPVFFEAPTGFGKTGVLLECALSQLRAGHFDRALYLTSKSTGQLQVVRTLSAMTALPSGAVESGKWKVESRSEPSARASSSDLSTFNPQLSTAATAVAAWHVRNKAEHCVNATFHCVRENCAYIADVESRWPKSGLSRFYLFENEPRDLESLRLAGRAATICPYEITRAALAFNDVWIGDYNYVFAPRNRGLFYDQPGFDPARTLLILDEAHNLPSRVADAFSHVARAADIRALLAELDHLRAPAPLVRAWESWTQLVAALAPVDALDPALEADVIDTVTRVAEQLATTPLDYAALGPQLSDILWQTQPLSEWLADPRLKKLLWCPRAGELHFTCIDAADAIGETLRAYGGVLFASATLSPVDAFAESCGLSNIPPSAQREFADPSLRNPQSAIRNPQFTTVTAHTPWRAGAYDVAFDARVDTSFQQRAKHHATTAATIEALHTASAAQNVGGVPSSRGIALRDEGTPPTPTAAIAVFFPSYAYAETIERTLATTGSLLRIAVQPRLHDLAAQAAWVEESLVLADALFLVLGSSFAESIDLLGGRVSHAMVVGPALPEVNAVQHARIAEFSNLGRAEAFRRVYQIPGMTKVNQALGRLVRAPGQRARVLLHCRRFLEPSYASLLAPDYQLGTNLASDADLAAWLEHVTPETT